MKLRARLDWPEPRSGSFLIAAIKSRRKDTVMMLTGNDKDRRVFDAEGKPVNMVEANARGPLGCTALFEACDWGDKEVGAAV